mmetsp:Transcript_12314/g.17534  ORF Transcript_12314/g.17534 Transcript_12314/m.17534 type:complete len:280 (+) Transcript_12314:64-903(+)
MSTSSQPPLTATHPSRSNRTAKGKKSKHYNVAVLLFMAIIFTSLMTPFFVMFFLEDLRWDPQHISIRHVKNGFSNQASYLHIPIGLPIHKSEDSEESVKSPLARGISGLPQSQTPALFGASRGVIECDVNVDALAYWNDPQGISDLEFQSPFVDDDDDDDHVVDDDHDQDAENPNANNHNQAYAYACTEELTEEEVQNAMNAASKRVLTSLPTNLLALESRKVRYLGQTLMERYAEGMEIEISQRYENLNEHVSPMHPLSPARQNQIRKYDLLAVAYSH